VIGAMGVVLALLAGKALHDPRSTSHDRRQMTSLPPLAVVRSLIQSKTIRNLFAAGTLALAAAVGLMTWLPALLTRVHGMTLTQAGIFLALAFGLAGAAGTYVMGRATDAVGRSDAGRKPIPIATCQCTLAALWLAALLVESSSVALVVMALACVLTGAYVGPTLAMVQDAVDPRARALSAAVLLFVVNLVGASLGPLAVGMLSDALAASAGSNSLRYALLLMPLLLLLSAMHYVRAASQRNATTE